MACCVQTWSFVNDFSPALKVVGPWGEGTLISEEARRMELQHHLLDDLQARREVAIGIWQGSSPLPVKGYLSGGHPQMEKAGVGNISKKTVKGIFSLMCLVGCWKISSTFFLHILY